MDDIYEFSKNFSLRIDEVEEVRYKSTGKKYLGPLRGLVEF